MKIERVKIFPFLEFKNYLHITKKRKKKTSTILFIVFSIAETQFMKQFTIFSQIHNLKTTHQLVQTSNCQVKVKHFSQKHVLFCHNLIFGLRWHTNLSNTQTMFLSREH